MSWPKISVITVVLNNKSNLEKTIASVLTQDYPYIEYIIIDGGSKDGTLEVIKKQAANLHYWVSEKDKGIYDAMNKGLKRATGDWVYFLNAGDVLYRKVTLSVIFKSVRKEDAILYGDIEFTGLDDGINRIQKSEPLGNLWKGMCFCHQGMFIRSKIIKAYPFDLKYKIAADFDLIYYCYHAGYKFRYLKQVIATYLLEGKSYNNYIQRCKEYRDIVNKYNRTWRVKLFYFFWLNFLYLKALRSLLAKLLKRLF